MSAAARIVSLRDEAAILENIAVAATQQAGSWRSMALVALDQLGAADRVITAQQETIAALRDELRERMGVRR